MKHQDQLRMGTVTTLDEPVMDTIVRLTIRFSLSQAKSKYIYHVSNMSYRLLHRNGT